MAGLGGAGWGGAKQIGRRGRGSLERDHSDHRSRRPLLDSARKERAKRWVGTDLRSYPALSAEEETEATLAAEPKQEQIKKGKTAKE